MGLSSISKSIIPQAFIILLTSSVALAGKPDLSLKIAATPIPAVQGQPLAYSLCVSNDGQQTANKVSVNNPIPAGAELLAAPSDCQIKASADNLDKILTCKANRLEAGSSVSWTFVVLPGVSELVDAATVNFNKADANPGNNAASLVTSLLPGSNSENSAGFYTLAAKAGNLPLDLNMPIAAKGKSGIYPIAANVAKKCDPAAPRAALKAVASAHTQLAFDSYRASQQYGADYNFALSTTDTLQTLAVLTAGASGKTRNAALDDTRGSLEEKSLHPAINAFSLDMTNRNQAAHLNQNFALWGQNRSAARKNAKYQFATPFLNTLVRNYGAELAAVDFTDSTALEQVIPAAINQWIANSSNAAIPGLLDQMPERTRLVSVGTTSLQGAWQIPANLTDAKRFENLDGSQVLTPMISFSGDISYTEGDGYQAFDLPLTNSDLTLTVLMPAHGRFTELQAYFNSERLNILLAAMQPKTMTLLLPKTSIQSGYILNDIARKLVESQAFVEGRANFSRVNGQGFLYLDSSLGQTVVSLDENGVQANAASQAILRANKNEPKTVWNDGTGSYGVISHNSNFCALIPHWDSSLALAHPFIFVIRDRTSGSVLFMGRLTKAEGQAVTPDSTTNSCP